MEKHNALVTELLKKPNVLKSKKPFTRGAKLVSNTTQRAVGASEMVEVTFPVYKRVTVTQDEFLRELDTNSHNVLFDENIPSFCVKRKDGTFTDIRQERIALPFQMLIKNKQLMHLTANPMQFTLVDLEPTDKQQEDFITFKQYWDLRNQDGMKNKMVDTQLSTGDAGLLFYFDYKGQIKSRILAYPDYILCPHNDQNGDRILESVYYVDQDTGIEYIDSYDDKNMYRYTRGDEDVNIEDTIDGWYMHDEVEHGFNEIPLITKRGDVAWNNVQKAIEAYEALYNILHVTIKKYGYNMLYVKGRFMDDGKRIAGAMILNDTSIDGKGDAKFLQYPRPDGAMETLDLMLKEIQLGSSTTFLLPEDVKTGGDVAGIAIQLVQSLDLELAHQKVIEWQNVADKMVRLFKFGLAKELVNKGKNLTAITDFENLNINAKFKVWRPLSDYEFNQMVGAAYTQGLISHETAIEVNTIGKPDEKARIKKEQEEEERKNEEQMLKQQQMEQSANEEKEEKEDE